jgi:hypothetical protein
VTLERGFTLEEPAGKLEESKGPVAGDGER